MTTLADRIRDMKRGYSDTCVAALESIAVEVEGLEAREAGMRAALTAIVEAAKDRDWRGYIPKHLARNAARALSTAPSPPVASTPSAERALTPSEVEECARAGYVAVPDDDGRPSNDPPWEERGEEDRGWWIKNAISLLDGSRRSDGDEFDRAVLTHAASIRARGGEGD